MIHVIMIVNDDEDVNPLLLCIAGGVDTRKDKCQFGDIYDDIHTNY